MTPESTAGGRFIPASPIAPPRLQPRAAPRTRPDPAWFPARMAPSTGTEANRSLTAAAEASLTAAEGVPMPEPEQRYDWADDPTAQDVIDALRMAFMAQKDPEQAVKVAECLLEFAPETDSGRGIDLLLRLISESTLKVALA
jgi:hypothetical protein